MKLYLINNARMPTEKAHGYQIAKMCESFATLGIDVELIIPNRLNKIKENIYEYYSVKKNFKVTYLSSFDFFLFEKFVGSKISFYVQSLFFQIKIKNEKLIINSDSVAITRNPELIKTLKNKGLKVFYDAHRWPESKNNIFKKMLSESAGIICNSHGTAEEFRVNGFLNVLVVPNGVDLCNYQLIIKNEELRRELDLPINKKIVMYVGHLYAWKGVDVVMEVTKQMEREDVVFVFVGGLEKDVARYKKEAVLKGLTNVLFCGHQKKELIPKYQMAADVLLLPNIPVNQESDRFTSPIKMFEYMASGVPIVASSLQSIKEVLNENNSLLVRSGDAGALKDGIERLLGDGQLAGRIAKQAREDVSEFTWEKRAGRIVDFIRK